MKKLAKRILPLFLIILLLAGFFPSTAMAAGPDISTEPTIEAIEDESQTVGTNPPAISTKPNIGDTAAPLPDTINGGEENTTVPEETSPPYDWDADVPKESDDPNSEEGLTDSSEALQGREDGEIDANTDTLDWASVEFENMRSLAGRASGTLSIHRFDQYQWNFSRGNSAPDICPWYIMTIGGQLA